jgi:two-component system sensor histidine kinase YesM
MIPFDLIHLGEEGFASFVSREGALITNTKGIKSFQLAPSLWSQSEESYQVVTNQDVKYIAVTNPIQGTDITLSAFIPEKMMLQKLDHFREFIFLIPILAAIVLIFYLVYLNDIIVRPMNHLIRGMRKIKHGDWEIRLNNSRSREFSIINESFNSMASEIHALKVNVYEEQIKAHKAELKHLQLQINPHFLLNSINIVYNLAEIKNYHVIQLMCLNLVKYFRFTTKTNQMVVTIAEEMEHMESYIKIQQLRFPDRVTYGYEIAKELETAAIPPLLIQPFIENAIKHGFDFMDEPFHINIRIMPIPLTDLFEIVISDNGSGFPEDVLVDIQRGTYLEINKGDHLGISNVHYRLKHIFGETSDLQFDNQVDSGAIVRIVLPIRTVEHFNG